MAEPSTPDEIEMVEKELRQYVELGVLEYYLPSDPAGVEYIVGAEHQIIKMNADQVPAFLTGMGVVARFLVRRKAMTW